MYDQGLVEEWRISSWRRARLPISDPDGNLTGEIAVELGERHRGIGQDSATAVRVTANGLQRLIAELAPLLSRSQRDEIAYWGAEVAVLLIARCWEGRLPGVRKVQAARVRVLTKRVLTKDADEHGSMSTKRVQQTLAVLGIQCSVSFIRRQARALRTA